MPATPPPAISQALYDSLAQPANLIATGRTGKIIRDIVDVQFKPSATLADRRAAIALVKGVVIGGTGEGSPEKAYVVRIPYLLSAGDSLVGPILRATKMLQALSTIDSATIEVLDPIAPQFRTPVDRGERVPLIPSSGVSRELLDSLGFVSGPPLSGGPFRRDVVIVEFKRGTILSLRQAAFDSVGGSFIGGILDDDGRDGLSYLRISGGTTAALLHGVQILQRQPGVEYALRSLVTPRDDEAVRRPAIPQRAGRKAERRARSQPRA